ncbi:MAG: DUF1343 domain-containing protein [Rhodopirellula sp.]|nr:DUF1343 domain-containing protein [Rhodopirellula sp.]
MVSAVAQSRSRLPSGILGARFRSASGTYQCVLLLVLACCSIAAATDTTLPTATPKEVNVDSGRLAEIDRIVADGMAAGEMPGCVVTIGRHGKIAFQKAYGLRQVDPEEIAMTTDAVFDLASLTKPVATATSVMLLIDDGKLKLNDRVADHLPEFAAGGKEPITVFHLLTHQGGLIPDNSLGDYSDGPEEAWRRIFASTPRKAAGEEFIYSDVGFEVLGKLVEKISGEPLDVFARHRIFQPLGMTATGYLPPGALRCRAVPTERRDDGWMVGEVHDPRAYLLGGVAGHAGLFSTAGDLAVYAQMLLNHGQYGSARILREETVAGMTRGYPAGRGLRGLGWDVRSGYSTNRGQALSPRAFGHGGFTGTVLWVDPELDLFFIFLSSRLHPDGKGSVNPLAGRIATVAAEAILDRPARQAAAGVLAGIDVLQRDGFRQLAGRRTGLITNQTGINREGVGTAKLLHDAENVRLVALFSPEHGIEGKLDVGNIGDTRDPTTGLHVWSLYGKTRKPTAEMLRDLDTIVFDIQDIGTRYYTYISTMGYAMQAAADGGKRFVVLDRPNPINGIDVAGPLLDAGRESFVGFHRLPVRHGMTIGELARMFREELKLDLDLEVIRVEGWRREMFFDETGLGWVNPSPNMRSLTEAILYPGIGMLETTNLSVGRGTATPFEHFGAPWLDGEKLADKLNAAAMAGVRFEPDEFTPDSSVYGGNRCRGVRITVTDRKALESVRMGLEVAHQLRILFPDQWAAEKYLHLLGNKQVHEALLAGKSVEEIVSLYEPERQVFLQRRAKFLLY